MLTLTGLLNDLVAADREGNWEDHLQVIQILLPFFMSGSINYLRYGYGYLEKMRSFSMKSQKCKNTCKREYVVKTNATYFEAVAADITWIQRSKRGLERIRRQTKHQTYATAWELSYQEVPAISKGYG